MTKTLGLLHNLVTVDIDIAEDLPEQTLIYCQHKLGNAHIFPNLVELSFTSSNVISWLVLALLVRLTPNLRSLSIQIENGFPFVSKDWSQITRLWPQLNSLEYVKGNVTVNTVPLYSYLFQKAPTAIKSGLHLELNSRSSRLQPMEFSDTSRFEKEITKTNAVLSMQTQTTIRDLQQSIIDRENGVRLPVSNVELVAANADANDVRQSNRFSVRDISR